MDPVVKPRDDRVIKFPLAMTQSLLTKTN
ncbi:MAG: hypothetical protein LN566_00185 [Rickettsia endosymbiont of Stiretrus anchorago]|nr:hypothetical protein [Rickettsia endosymbiont of Stiretrus anchorago]